MATARSSVKVNDLLSLEDIWRDLKSGIEQIFGRQTLPRRHFLVLYSRVYNYCEQVARATKTKEGPQQTKRAPFVGQELYQRLADFLKDFLKAYQDDGLLKVCS